MKIINIGTQCNIIIIYSYTYVYSLGILYIVFNQQSANFLIPLVLKWCAKHTKCR